MRIVLKNNIKFYIRTVVLMEIVL